MSGGLRRVALVLVAYVVVAWIVIALAGQVQPLLALPGSFVRILRAGLGLGLPVALLVAWNYPRIGHHGAHPPDREEGG
jgi:hypothetical protein